MHMPSAASLAEIASLVGDPARANILSALMDGRALTAGELSWHAGVSPQTTSGHLAKLVGARLLAVDKQGRHRYHRLASPEVARLLETLMGLSALAPPRVRRTGPPDEAMRRARSCYDHLAGRLGTGLADSLRGRGYVIIPDDEEGVARVTETGRRFLQDELGLDWGGAGKRPLCRTCLDWSERRPHFAGRLGAALCERLLELGWIARVAHCRTIAITPGGERGLMDRFGLTV